MLYNVRFNYEVWGHERRDLHPDTTWRNTFSVDAESEAAAFCEARRMAEQFAASMGYAGTTTPAIDSKEADIRIVPTTKEAYDEQMRRELEEIFKDPLLAEV